jgi:hypothetical protein
MLKCGLHIVYLQTATATQDQSIKACHTVSADGYDTADQTNSWIDAVGGKTQLLIICGEPTPIWRRVVRTVVGGIRDLFL